MITRESKAIEALFIEEPLKRNKVGAKPVKTPANGLDSVSSFGLVKELAFRHWLDVQIVGFWVLFGVFIWNKLG